MSSGNWKIHSLFLAAANEEKQAGGDAFQADCLSKDQQQSDHRVHDSIFTEDRFEPVTQKLKNKEEIDRDKDAVDDQLTKKICEGVLSGPFHAELSVARKYLG